MSEEHFRPGALWICKYNGAVAMIKEKDETGRVYCLWMLHSGRESSLADMSRNPANRRKIQTVNAKSVEDNWWNQLEYIGNVCDLLFKIGLDKH